MPENTEAKLKLILRYGETEIVVCGIRDYLMSPADGVDMNCPVPLAFLITYIADAKIELRRRVDGDEPIVPYPQRTRQDAGG